MYELSKDDINDQLRPILKQIYPSEVKRDEIFYERDNLIKTVLEEFKLRCLEICPIFELLFDRFFYTGSAYEGLQVKHPVEFDVNIVLKFPVRKNKIYLQELEDPLSFCTLKAPWWYLNSYPDLSRLFDQNYLIAEKVLSWLQSLIDKVLLSPTFQLPHGINDITKTKSGPAYTLKLLHRRIWLSIDLAPVFEVNFETRLKCVTKMHKIVSSENLSNFFLVPKPLKYVDPYHLTADEHSTLWLIHYEEAELDIMWDRLAMKLVIKLVKCLRDKEGWKIPSYFIKTVVFKIIKQHPNPQYFCENNLGARFLQVLDLLQRSLKRNYLGHIFYPKFNLLYGMKTEILMDVSMRIKEITKELRANPSSAFDFFRYSENYMQISPLKTVSYSYRNNPFHYFSSWQIF